MAVISKTYGRLLAILLAWSGISTCEQAKEYGTPCATFKAKGVVVSETDDKPIEGIRAVLKTQQNTTYGMDTVYTDSKGAFNLYSWNPEIYSYKLYVELADVDGDKNGLFIDMGVEADYSNAKFTGGDGNWNMGVAEKDLGIIKMKPQE